MTRRSFLTGATWAAMSVALPAQQAPEKPEKRPPTDPFERGKDETPPEKKLIDDEGREYRVCPQCGNNMYKQGRMWVCEVCGYSYVE